MIETNSTPRFAALFLDFENIYYYLREEYQDPPHLNDAILELLRNLHHHLNDQFGLDCIISNAYADFERVGTTPQGALFLLGVDTKNVLGTDHKNAADMRLCIDALEVLYTRQEIQSFVLVTGDRDYIPLIQHLRRKARHVLGAGFKVKASGDLLMNLGTGNFIDLMPFLSPNTREGMATHRDMQLQLQQDAKERMAKQAQEIEEKARLAREAQAATAAKAAIEAKPKEEVPEKPKEESSAPEKPKPVEPIPEWRFATPRTIVSPDACECLRLILSKLNNLQRTNQTNELWLGPFKRQLTDDMPQLADWERRAIIEELTHAGAIAVEKRDGDPYPFSVIVVNYRHPDVWKMNSLAE